MTEKISKEAFAESEIILNKTNLALARSRKLIQSWLPPLEGDSARDDEDDDDFKTESELAGIGAVANHDDDSALARLQRTKHSKNDRLLEQLLGKKGAQQHKKSQAASQAAAAKPANRPAKTSADNQQQASDSDSDAEGRVATLLSKQQKSKPAKVKQQKAAFNRDGDSEKQKVVPVSDQATDSAPDSTIQPAALPTKRKAKSYLDELLAQRSKKKSKRTG